jgi:hypothetical protein
MRNLGILGRFILAVEKRAWEDNGDLLEVSGPLVAGP